MPADTMVIPQQPYFPDRPLRNALNYPGGPQPHSDEAMREALAQAQLPHLANALDTTRNWSQTLSGGEQQRLAIARVLLRQPQWVLADEATSALDTPTAQLLYGKLQAMTQARGGGLISIAYGDTLAQFHTTRWQLVPAHGQQAQATQLAPEAPGDMATGDTHHTQSTSQSLEAGSDLVNVSRGQGQFTVQIVPAVA